MGEVSHLGSLSWPAHVKRRHPCMVKGYVCVCDDLYKTAFAIPEGTNEYNICAQDETQMEKPHRHLKRQLPQNTDAEETSNPFEWVCSIYACGSPPAKWRHFTPGLETGQSERSQPFGLTAITRKWVHILGDAWSFSGLTSKIAPLASMLNLDADVKK